MTENQALDYILSLPKLTYPLGNGQLMELLSLLGNPQKDLKFIHIAGTNGKGSAAAMLGSILTDSGYKTGVFTSPYIISFNERIRIGKENISGERLAYFTALVSETMNSNNIRLSQFAFILALALLYYKDEQCDAVVLEVGLGGRLDATNIIDESLVSVIMSISLDHTELLGNTVAEIAKEKCGIIKPNGAVVAYKSSPEAMEVIENCCKEQNATLYIAGESHSTPDGFCSNNTEYSLSLKGDYQAGNAATVLEAVKVLRLKGFEIPEQALRSGFRNCTHRARFERIRENIIVDGAHNEGGAKALAEALKGIDKRKTAVIAMMEDKAVDDVLLTLKDSFERVIITELDMPRCMKADMLSEKAQSAGMNVLTEPCTEKAFELAEREEFAVICGSIYLTGKALEYWEDEK
ncbi:MAG: bifunctional folylpolyglutamate synthase/dihydrofolate synthase [Eubacteriales bacterium]|nr:bifunctional folylpolyglutamate synthase/dihydrofolate synthase [Eubacteriales bacterium]